MLHCIEEALEGRKEHHTYLLPYAEGALLHSLQSRYVPDRLEYLPEGILLELTLGERDAAAVAKFAEE